MRLARKERCFVGGKPCLKEKRDDVPFFVLPGFNPPTPQQDPSPETPF